MCVCMCVCLCVCLCVCMCAYAIYSSLCDYMLSWFHNEYL